MIRKEIEKHEYNLDLVKNITLMREKDGVHLYRFQYKDLNCVIKYFEKQEYAREIEYYKLFQALGIPTIPVYSINQTSIILEDIQYSDKYRLGKIEDFNNVKVAEGLYNWYQMLHKKGEELSKERPGLYEQLYSEYCELTSDMMVEVMKRADASQYNYFNLFVRQFDKIKDEVIRLTNTLTYNDFYYTNFIVSKDLDEVIMFDYNFLGKGFRYSDIRNVMVQLKGDTKKRFLELYSDYDKTEQLLDDVLSVLFGLHFAYKQNQFPSWAESELEKVHNGDFEMKVNALLSHLKLNS